MKKHLRSKNYIRSRESVVIGRDNKRIRKINRFTRNFKRVDWQGVFDFVLSKVRIAIQDIVTAVNEMRIPSAN